MGSFLTKWLQAPSTSAEASTRLHQTEQREGDDRSEPAAESEIPRDIPDLDAPDLIHARHVLNEAEVHKFVVSGAVIIGIWSDLDSPEIRAALRALDADRLPVRYLDGAGVPMQYKVRRVEGEPVSISVLAEMEQRPADPWMVRDRLPNNMGRGSKGVSCPNYTGRNEV